METDQRKKYNNFENYYWDAPISLDELSKFSLRKEKIEDEEWKPVKLSDSIEILAISNYGRILNVSTKKVY